MAENLLETYNLINYIKILDLSLLNLLDYAELNDSKLLALDEDKLVLNLNTQSKRLLEGFIVNNINNETYYGKHNMLVFSCKPEKNWRNIEKETSTYRIVLKDDSIFIDELKFNAFAAQIFKKLPSLSAMLVKKIGVQKIFKSEISIQKDLKFLEFNDIDATDLYMLLGRTLSTFGNVNKDIVNYNIISDGNLKYMHDTNCITNDFCYRVKSELIKKGII